MQAAVVGAVVVDAVVVVEVEVVVVTQLVVAWEQVIEPQRLLATPQKVLHCSVQSLPAQRVPHSVLAL